MTTYTEAGTESDAGAEFGAGGGTPAPVPPPAAAPTPPPATGPTSASPRWSPVPQVNLLPPEILADRRFRRLKGILIGVAVGVLLLCAAGAVWAQGQVSAAQADLAAMQDQGRRLEQEQARYADVPRTLAELDRVKVARETAMGADVLWYQFLGDLALNTPAQTELSSVVIAVNGGTAVAPASASLLEPAGLGTVKVTGKALSFVDVASWLDDVDKVHGLAGSGLESASKGQESTASTDGGATAPAGGADAGSASAAEQGVKFIGSAVVVPAALSHRYDRKAG